MKTNKKIFIDRIIGGTIALPLNLLVRIVGFLTRFDHSLRQPKVNIAICKFKGMGSIIQSTPLLATLKKEFPGCKITYISSVENQKILKEIDLIDDIILVNDNRLFVLLTTTFSALRKIISRKFDLYIDLEIYSNYSSIIATLSMARDRFGYYLNTSKYRMGMYTHMMYFNNSAPITEAYLQFARLLKCKEMCHETYSFSHIKKAVQPHIIINPNASDLRIERRWSAENFTELIGQLLTEFPLHDIILIGSANEQAYVTTIAATFQDEKRIKNLSGKTTIPELLAIIGSASLIITNDTGPMHLATAMNKRTVALFGPCSPAQYAIGENLFPIYNNLYCSPCVHEFIIPPCKGNNSCMKTIEVTTVFSACQQMMDPLFSVRPSVTKMYRQGEENVFGMVTR